MGEMADYYLKKAINKGISNKKLTPLEVVTLIARRTINNPQVLISKEDSTDLMWEWFHKEGNKYSKNWLYPKDRTNLEQVIKFTLECQSSFKKFLMDKFR